jgi:hypothetical protein
MPAIWFNSETPVTKFAPNLKIPLYTANEGNDTFINSLVQQVYKFEEQIIKEDLVSEVPRNDADPYPFTQHWKQHNLLWDVDAKGGETLERFPMSPELEKFFHIIRKQYLLFLKELNYPRYKVYVHAWANVLRNGQWISKHHHTADNYSYISGTYYLTTNPTHLKIISPIRMDQMEMFATKKASIVMFPSWVPHESDVYKGDDTRVSLAFDICLEGTLSSNPWRPHVLLDDPDTMDGFEMYLKDRSLTA